MAKQQQTSDNVLDQILPEGTVFRSTHFTKISKDSNRAHQHTLIFDLGGVPLRKLCELCAQTTSLVVEWQRKFREHPERFPEGEVTIKVKDHAAKGRGLAPIVIKMDSLEDLVATLEDPNTPAHVQEALLAILQKGVK